VADKDSTLDAIGKEMKASPPAVLNATRRKFGVARAEKQRKAILLSKARAAGVKIPSASPAKFSK
jgi:hypothetical protein